MPTICAFYGIIIQMFWNDNAPPHFHALYAEYEAIVDIQTLNVIPGKMARRALSLVLEWAFFIEKNYWRTGTYAKKDRNQKNKTFGLIPSVP